MHIHIFGFGGHLCTCWSTGVSIHEERKGKDCPQTRVGHQKLSHVWSQLISAPLPGLIPAIVKTSALSKCGVTVSTRGSCWIGITLRRLRKRGGIKLYHHRGGLLGSGVGQRSAWDNKVLASYVISWTTKRISCVTSPFTLRTNDSLVQLKSNLKVDQSDTFKKITK